MSIHVALNHVTHYRYDRLVGLGPQVVRLRCNVYQQTNGMAAAFRLLPTRILTVEQLGLPPQVLRFAEMNRGLVVVTATSSSDLIRNIIAEIRDESVDSGRPEPVFRHRDGVDVRRRR